MEAAVFEPSVGKIDFSRYFQRVKTSSEIHQKLISTVLERMMTAGCVGKYSAMLDRAIKRTLHK
jgi:hypothetical protein